MVNTRSQSMAPSEAPSEAPSQASTVSRTAGELLKLQISDKKTGKKNGTAGSAVAARNAAHRAAASDGVSTRARRATSNTPLFALPMDPVRRPSTAASTASSTSTVRPTEGVSTRASTARTGAPLAMLPPAPPRKASTANRPRPMSIMEAYERRQSEIAANAAAQVQVPQSNLATPAAHAMLRRAAANGRVSTTPAASGGASTTADSRSHGAGSVAAAGASGAGGGAASGGSAPPPPPPPRPLGGGSGHGDDNDVVMGDDDEEVEEEEEAEEEGAGEGEEQSDQPFVRGTRLTAAQLAGLAPRPPITYWGRAMPLNKNSRTLPQQAYSLPTKDQLARIVDNFYKHIPRSKMSYDRCNNCWLGFREWLQQTGLWDGQSVWPETQYDELVRISGIKASRVTARGGRNCDRCVSVGRTRCGLQQDNACEVCIRAGWPCTFTDTDGATTYQNGTGNLENMSGGYRVTRGFPGQQLATIQLPQPLDPWLPPTDLPVQVGSYRHHRDLQAAQGPRRARPAPKVAVPAQPPRWADDEYGFSDLSGSDDSGNLENEAEEFRDATPLANGKRAKNTSLDFSLRATTALPPAFFPVLSRRQMHRILVWWSQNHAQGLKQWTRHRRMFFAYAQWAFANGWYDPATQRFEVHFNVLYATMGGGRRQRVSTNCDRCIAHHSEIRCQGDQVNACLPCIAAEVPCTVTNYPARHTLYLNGAGHVPAGSQLRVTPAGQNISYVNMRVPRELIVGLFPPNTAKKYLKATSAPALPPLGNQPQLPVAPPGPPPGGPPPGPRPIAPAGPPPGYMPAQPWQSALPQQQEQQALQPTQTEQGYIYPPVPTDQEPWEQQMPPQQQELVAGVGQAGQSVHEQVTAWGAQQLHWSNLYMQSQQRQTALKMTLFGLGVSPDVGSLMTPLPPALPQFDPVANAQRQAQQELARLQQSEAENVRLRAVIDATSNAQPSSVMSLDPALAQPSPFAQPPRAQQPFVQQPFVQQPFAPQTPQQQTAFPQGQGNWQMTEFQQSFYQPLNQQTAQAAPAPAPVNPFAPMGLDVRPGQPQSSTGNPNQRNTARPQRQPNTLTLGNTRLHEPMHRRVMGQQTTSQPGQGNTGATPTTQGTAGQAITIQAPTGQTVATSTNTRTTTARPKASTRKPPASRTATGRVTKPKNKLPTTTVLQQPPASAIKHPSMKELKRRRKELKAMKASGELDDENIPIPVDITLLWGIYAPTGEEVTSGSEDEGADSGAAVASAVGSGTGNAEGFSNVAAQNTGFSTGTDNANYNAGQPSNMGFQNTGGEYYDNSNVYNAGSSNMGVQNPGFVSGNNNNNTTFYNTGGPTNMGAQNARFVPGNDANMYNSGGFTNMDVQNPGFVAGTDNTNAYTSTQPATMDPQDLLYTNTDVNPRTHYRQDQFNAGEESFMDLLGDDAAGMFSYDNDINFYGGQQPEQDEDFDMGG